MQHKGYAGDCKSLDSGSSPLIIFGQMAEWSKALVLKANGMQVLVGSNPTLSFFYLGCFGAASFKFFILEVKSMKKSSGVLVKLLKNLILDKTLKSLAVADVSVILSGLPRGHRAHYLNLPAYYNFSLNAFSNLLISPECQKDNIGCIYLKINNLFIFRAQSLFILNSKTLQQVFFRFLFSYSVCFMVPFWRMCQKSQ